MKEDISLQELVQDGLNNYSDEDLQVTSLDEVEEALGLLGLSNYSGEHE